MAKMARVIIHRVDTPEEADNILKKIFDAIEAEDREPSCKGECESCSACKDGHKEPHDSREEAKQHIAMLVKALEQKHEEYLEELASLRAEIDTLEDDYKEAVGEIIRHFVAETARL